MAKTEQGGNSEQKTGIGERGSRFLRNVHAVGSLALLGAAVVFPPAAVALEAGAAFEAVHAGGWEVARQHFAKKDKKNSSK